jgi:hypothetical protein
MSEDASEAKKRRRWSFDAAIFFKDNLPMVDATA